MAEIGILRTPEFRRIDALPRRVAEPGDHAAELTLAYRKPGSLAELRPWQGYSLAEAAENGGAVLGLPVGQGKTLICELLPHVMVARRPLLIIPSSTAIREKTLHDRAIIAKDWRLADPPPRITTVQELSVEAGAGLLDRYQPDLIIIDEADTLANTKSSAVRRIDRYVRRCRDRVSVVAMTGTLSRKSILGYWHLIHWCLHEAPLPVTYSEARVWASALDERPPGQFGVRVKPGAMGKTIEEARSWYLARLAYTPGIVIVDEDSCDQPLVIRERIAREDPILDAAFRDFALESKTPGGEYVSDSLSAMRLDCQLGTGVVLRYVPPGPPADYVDARREFCGFVRTTIAKSDRLDTELQVRKAHAEHPTVQTWEKLRKRDYPTEALRITDSCVESVRDWLRESTDPGIIWTGSVEFGEWCASALRLPYYGAEGVDMRSGLQIHAANPKLSMVCSWHANKRGFNLQSWARQLWTHPPSSAKFLEQGIGRSHRAGQTKPVDVTILVTSGGTSDRLSAAIREAQFAADTVGMRQKILRAEIIRATPVITDRNKYRWARAQPDTDEE